MKRRPASSLVTVALAVAPLVALAGCGAPSAEERRAKRADYVRDAERTCATMRTALNSSVDTPSFVTLKKYLARGSQAVGDGTDRLHDLRGKLDESASPEIKAFDRRIDAARDATEKLRGTARGISLNATVGEARAVSAAAQRARRAFDGLYRTAQAAKLDDCGRGGNRLADNALFPAYRNRMLAVDIAAAQSYRRVRFNGDRAHDRAAVVRDVRVTLAAFRRVKRLEPPSGLLRPHRRYLRAVAAELRLKRRANRLLAGSLADADKAYALVDAVNRAQVRTRNRSRPLFAALDLTSSSR